MSDLRFYGDLELLHRKQVSLYLIKGQLQDRTQCNRIKEFTHMLTCKFYLSVDILIDINILYRMRFIVLVRKTRLTRIYPHAHQ